MRHLVSKYETAIYADHPGSNPRLEVLCCMSQPPLSPIVCLLNKSVCAKKNTKKTLEIDLLILDLSLREKHVDVI